MIDTRKKKFIRQLDESYWYSCFKQQKLIDERKYPSWVWEYILSCIIAVNKIVFYDIY